MNKKWHFRISIFMFLSPICGRDRQNTSFYRNPKKGLVKKWKMIFSEPLPGSTPKNRFWYAGGTGRPVENAGPPKKVKNKIRALIGRDYRKKTPKSLIWILLRVNEHGEWIFGLKPPKTGDKFIFFVQNWEQILSHLQALQKISKSPVPPTYREKKKVFRNRRKKTPKTLKTEEKRLDRVFSEHPFLG